MSVSLFGPAGCLVEAFQHALALALGEDGWIFDAEPVRYTVGTVHDDLDDVVLGVSSDNPPSGLLTSSPISAATA
jgi:hypothetical protein